MSKPMHQVRVAAISKDLPGIISIDFDGDLLDADGGRTAAPHSSRLEPRRCVDDHVKIVLPGPDGQAGADSPEASGPSGSGTSPLLRTYTRRRYDPATGAWGIDIFVFPHGGPGSSWAAGLAVGDVVTVRGPGGHWQLPADPGTVLMVGDPVAQPAIANALEALPQGARAIVLLEEGPHRYPLPERPGAEIQMVPSSPGGSALVEAVRRVPTPAGPWWAFVHGQADMVRPLRRHLRVERGLPKDHMNLSAYWISGGDAEAWRAMKSAFNRQMIADSGD